MARASPRARRPPALQALELEGKIVDDKAIVIQAHERCVKDVTQVLETHITKTDPDAENRREDDQPKDDQCCR
jgi:hypothetical protein